MKDAIDPDAGGGAAVGQLRGVETAVSVTVAPGTFADNGSPQISSFPPGRSLVIHLTRVPESSDRPWQARRPRINERVCHVKCRAAILAVGAPFQGDQDDASVWSP
jgi:hypothetical protein